MQKYTKYFGINFQAQHIYEKSQWTLLTGKKLIRLSKFVFPIIRNFELIIVLEINGILSVTLCDLSVMFWHFLIIQSCEKTEAG